MRLRFTIRDLLWLAVVVALAGAEAKADQIKLSNVSLANDPDNGTATFCFKIDLPKGTRFYISYLTVGVRGAAGTNHIWEIAGDQGAAVELKFAYREDYHGDRSVSVLDSPRDARIPNKRARLRWLAGHGHDRQRATVSNRT